ncbi:hypothetical protein L9F63_026059, partial [Diploptera punctata]
ESASPVIGIHYDCTSVLPKKRSNPEKFKNLFYLFLEVDGVASTYKDPSQQLFYAMCSKLADVRSIAKMGCRNTDRKIVSVNSSYVEVVDMKVTVCRDAVKGKCVRPLCKYYHIPIPLPPANEMAAHQGQGCDKTYLDVSLTNASLDFSGTSSPSHKL